MYFCSCSYCIFMLLFPFTVGGGTAGAVVASRLSEKPCVNVLLLEAGPEPPLLTEVPALGRYFWFTDVDWKYKTTPQKHTGRALVNRVRKNFCEVSLGYLENIQNNN